MSQHLTGWVCLPLPFPHLAAKAVIDGEGRRANWTSHGDWRRGSAVVQGHTPVHSWEIWLKWRRGRSSVGYRRVAGPSDQGHFPDEVLTAAYDQVVRSSPFLTDMLTSWVLIWGWVLYIGVHIFTLWQKSKIGVRIIFDGVLYFEVLR